ncbi:hypothetical protein [Paenibacillus macerans]|uniref:hypothetical protein n=1 Tax=Paenibacillus macerans TaxID=44252 RepID=UPI00204032FC|nr:hypothetical protein [Paenibacillus macerans]MCM3703805.1 hypothetical protein [Paenibacillus macerans]
MTVLIAFICITLAAAVGTTTFIFGRQIGYVQRDNEAKEQAIKEMQQQMEVMTLEYKQLEVQYQQEQRDNKRRNITAGGWDPGQLSNREYV